MVKKQQTPMREQDPKERIHNFAEVMLGYTEEEAIAEASRCLQCANPTCVTGCPVHTDIPRFINQLKNRQFADAIATIEEANYLPAVCGRICPHEQQCEGACVMGKRFEPVAIGALERFVADWDREHGPCCPPVGATTGFRVAVIGSGPAGLTVAGELRKYGHAVTVFERMPVAGGVLTYGIPKFRLPKPVVAYEIAALQQMGVEFTLGQAVGPDYTIDDLLNSGYDAVFVGTGASRPRRLGVPGEDLAGVYTADDFLMRTNLAGLPDFPAPPAVGTRAITIGGGSVAMDAARTALRLGATESIILYRRSAAELPAGKKEIDHAFKEGVQLQFLTAPVRFIGRGGQLIEVECVRMRLGEPDESGRRRPIPVPGSEFTMPADTVITAIGNEPSPDVIDTTPGLVRNQQGYIAADPQTGKTSREGVFAGGDIVTGPATVIQAIGAGRRAAAAIDNYLRQKGEQP